MIERTVIMGKPATVAYLDGDFAPVNREAAILVKVIFDDGKVLFAMPAAQQPRPLPKQAHDG